MKVLLFSVFVLCISISVSSQDISYEASQKVSIERFHTDLLKSKSIQDTIVAIITLNTTSRLDTNTVSQLLSEALIPKYPAWFEVEKVRSKWEQSSSVNIETFEIFVEQSKSLALRNYALMLLRLVEIIQGKSNKINDEFLTQEVDDPKIKLFNNYLRLSQYIELKERDSILFFLKSDTAGISDDIYPGLQLAIVSKVTNFLFPHITTEAYPYIIKGLRLSDSLREYKQKGKLYNYKSAYHRYEGEAAEAMQYMLKFIDVSEKTNEFENAIAGYLNISAQHQDAGLIDEANNMILKARSLAQKYNSTKGLAWTFSAEGTARMNESKYGEALLLHKKSLDVNPNQDLSSKSQVYVNIIDCYYSTSKLDSAYLYFQKLKELDPKNSTGYLDFAKSFISKHLVQLGEYTLAQEYIDATFADAKAYADINSESLAWQAQSYLFEAIGNHKAALDAYKKHIILELDFRNEKEAAEITKIQLSSKYESEKKILALTNEKERLKIENQRNRAILFSGLAIFAALTSLGFYIFMRRKNKLIHSQKEKLEELNKVKDTLFQIIGHDLKKPTINFRNVSNNINYLLDKNDYTRLQKLGEEVDQDAKSLYNLTDNLLNWAVMQKNTLSIKPENVYVSDIVKNNIDLFVTLANRKNIVIENKVSEEIYSKVDRNSLDTIVRNLIDNAIKYTPVGGVIAITSQNSEGMVKLSISDSGVGMDVATLYSINNNESIESKKGTADEVGSGIGLQLVKSLIEKNNGSMNIQSEYGKGSTFQISLPLAS